jgi:hypothetical protein
MKAYIELTDTFGGEANYSWVKRYEFDAAEMSARQIERKARDLVGLTDVKCSRVDYGDMVEWRPRNACMVAFLTFEY